MFTVATEKTTPKQKVAICTWTQTLRSFKRLFRPAGHLNTARDKLCWLKRTHWRSAIRMISTLRGEHAIASPSSRRSSTTAMASTHWSRKVSRFKPKTQSRPSNASHKQLNRAKERYIVLLDQNQMYIVFSAATNLNSIFFFYHFYFNLIFKK